MQVRHFAAHYAGDEGLARPFSAMPSDRNLAWGDQASGLQSPDRQVMRHRPDSSQPAAMSPSTRQVGNLRPKKHCIKHMLQLPMHFQYKAFVLQRQQVAVGKQQSVMLWCCDAGMAS